MVGGWFLRLGDGLLVFGGGSTMMVAPGSNLSLSLFSVSFPSTDREDHDTDRRWHRLLQRSALRHTR